MRYFISAVIFSGLVTCVTVLANENKFQNISIEVGFSFEKDPEPHLVLSDNDGLPKVYELSNARKSRAIASSEGPKAEMIDGKNLPKEAFYERAKTLIDEANFFTAKQVKRKSRCRDEYVLKVQWNGKTKERHGCANQSDDPFATTAQLIYKDAFQAWRKGLKTRN